MIKKEIVKGSGIYRRLDKHSRNIIREISKHVGEEVMGKKLRDVLIFVKLYYGVKLRGKNKIYIRDEKKIENRINRYKKGSGHWRWCYEQRKRSNRYIRRRKDKGEGEEVKDM